MTDWAVFGSSMYVNGTFDFDRWGWHFLIGRFLPFRVGGQRSIEIKDHSVYLHLVLAIGNTGFSLCAVFTYQTEHALRLEREINIWAPVSRRE